MKEQGQMERKKTNKTERRKGSDRRQEGRKEERKAMTIE